MPAGCRPVSVNSVLQTCDALARVATKPECWHERISFSASCSCNCCNSITNGRAMRRGQRRHHVVLYVAPGNRMRCRFNRDSVHDTPHEQPPLQSLHRLVFSARHSACERTFVGRRLNFRHAGTHSSRAVRSAKLGKNSRCILREVFYVNTSAAVKRARSTHPTLGAQRSSCAALCAPNAASSALASGFMKNESCGIDATCTE
jgi:hypothetical protein